MGFFSWGIRAGFFAQKFGGFWEFPPRVGAGEGGKRAGAPDPLWGGPGGGPGGGKGRVLGILF